MKKEKLIEDLVVAINEQFTYYKYKSSINI